MELKRPTTYDEQVNLLRQKGITITHIDLYINFLSKINYYRLSGYYLPFIVKKEKHCFIPIPFEQIQNIYTFDVELRNLTSRCICQSFQAKSNVTKCNKKNYF